MSNSTDLLRLICGQPALEKPLGQYALRSLRSLGGFKFLRCYFSHFDRISYLVCFYVRYIWLGVGLRLMWGPWTTSVMEFFSEGGDSRSVCLSSEALNKTLEKPLGELLFLQLLIINSLIFVIL